MKNLLTKDVLTEILVILFLSLSQILLFLSGFNLLVILLITPIYILAATKNVYVRLSFSFVISSIILIILSKPLVSILFLLITYVIPIILYISIFVIKDWRHDFMLISAGYLLFQVLSIKALKVVYKVDVLKESNYMLKSLFGRYFKAIGETFDVDRFLKVLNLMMPSFFIIESITLALVTIYISKWIINKLKIQKEYIDFDRLFMPKEVTIGAITFLIIQLFLKEFNMTYVIVSNIIIIICYLLFIQSLSLIYSILADKIAIKLIRNIIMIFIISICLQLFILSAFIGFLDLLFDFKKRKPKRVEK